MTRNDFISQLRDGVTDFSGVDFRGMDFSFLHLNGLNFKDANLSGCTFYCTSLYNCNFENANLSRIKMSRTALYKVNLMNALLDNAIFDFDRCIADEVEIDANMMNKHFPLVCPNEGEFIGWKKACIMDVMENGIIIREVIVKLLIPSDAKRSSAFGRKCRCDKAKVISIECLYDPDKLVSAARSFFDKAFIYKIGEEVSVDNFDADRRHGCAPGIHFFMTREEAVDY